MNSADTLPKDLSMPMAVVIATVLHAFVIFGISFSAGKSASDMAMDVATVLTQTLEKNEEARFIANATQQGSGDVRQQLRLESSYISPEQDRHLEQVQDIINLQKQTRQQAYQASYLRTTLSVRQAPNKTDNKDEQKDELEIQEERVRQKIATLEAQISQRNQELASKTKVETVDSNSTTHGKAATYLEQFRIKVEKVANQYYPPQARLQRITGDVRLMVVINFDGSVKTVRLLESSGSPILDKAAKDSIVKSAPYGSFDQDMKDIVELRVVRTWRYTDKLEVSY